MLGALKKDRPRWMCASPREGFAAGCGDDLRLRVWAATAQEAAPAAGPARHDDEEGCQTPQNTAPAAADATAEPPAEGDAMAAAAGGPEEAAVVAGVEAAAMDTA